MGRNNTPKEQLIAMAYKAGAASKALKDKRVEEYNKNPSLCKHCGKPLDYERRKNKFCNSSCAAKHNNLGVNRYYSQDKRKAMQKELDNKFCKNCGKKMEYTGTTTIKKFLARDCCCQDCYNELKQKEFVAKWKAGEISGTSSENDIHERVRNYMLEKANYSCEICGWHEVNPTTGKVPVQVHHIDGDCTNNREENLQVLCPNCHSLTPTYGAQNKGSGRFNRLKYKTKKYLEEKAKEEL